MISLSFLSRSGFRVSLLSLALLGGCATTGELGDPRDPLEAFNRSIYSFNDTVDRSVLQPVAKGYQAVTPEPVQRGIGNFFSNLGDLRSAANNLLQLKIDHGLSDMARFFINSTVGIAGLIDVASTINIPKYDEDFGQTLGYWGVEPGPYLVLPLLGPSSLRDAVGVAADWQVDPLNQVNDKAVRYPATALKTVDTRAQLLNATNLLEHAALDPYAFTRDAYLQRRLDRVYDGNPPLDFDEDLFD